jgi:hypothetical protein
MRRGEKSQDQRRPRLADLTLIRWPINHDEIASLHFDLTENEFGCIGLVVVQWSYLEYALYYRSTAMVKRAKLLPPKDITNLSFTRRLRCFRELFDTVIKHPKTKSYYVHIAERIARAEGYRHRVIHDLWSYNPRNPEQLWVTKAKPPIGRSEPFDVQKLAEHAQAIGQLSFLLMYPPGSEGPRSRALEYVSRRFLLMLQRKDQQDQDHPRPNPEGRTPPRSS